MCELSYDPVHATGASFQLTLLWQAGDDFTELLLCFKPLLQTVLLIWRHSGHWNSPVRLVTLVRQICNQLVAHARVFCPGAALCLTSPPRHIWRQTHPECFQRQVRP